MAFAGWWWGAKVGVVDTLMTVGGREGLRRSMVVARVSWVLLARGVVLALIDRVCVLKRRWPWATHLMRRHVVWIWYGWVTRGWRIVAVVGSIGACIVGGIGPAWIPPILLATRVIRAALRRLRRELLVPLGI